jgi:hypothetical protein
MTLDPVNELKRFILRALWQLKGIPWPDTILEDAARQAVLPRPLQSELNQAKRELEQDGFIQGDRDELDGSLTWTLTAKGRHRAKQLNN